MAHLAQLVTNTSSLASIKEFAGSNPRSGKHSVIEVGHEIFCLPLIYVGQLSVTGERMCT